jgi:hypothetical protein
VNWRLGAIVTASLVFAGVVAVVLTNHVMDTGSNGTSDPIVRDSSDAQTSGTDDAERNAISEPSNSSEPSDSEIRLLYTEQDIASYRLRMTRTGPYFSPGDAGHGGPYSPDDGHQSVVMSRDFLADPDASYWSHPDLPYTPDDPWPADPVYVRPMHAAWVYLTQPQHPDSDLLQQEVASLLLQHASDESHDFSNAEYYPLDYPGFAPSPIFGHAHWMTRLIKARDMVGRRVLSEEENAIIDEWFYDYANWTANWIHQEGVGKWLPGRLERDYSVVDFQEDASRHSYDGGPLIGSAGMSYHNRSAAVASAMSLAANYLKHHKFVVPDSSAPAYGRLSVDELLEHSRLFVEETIRFSLWPEGVQGDFERGDLTHHVTATPQLGWLYSANTLANLIEIAEYHAKRGDMSVWNYGTTEGYDGSAGVPVAGDFTEKNLHFFAWSMSRYVNDEWQRTNYGEPLATPDFYHDVIPAAVASRFAPNDDLLRSAWRRSGLNFPAYPSSPRSQGIWPAHLGEGAKMVGLIEHADASPLGE